MSERAAQRGVGVLAVGRRDELAPQSAGPRLGGAVATDVDAAAQAPRAGHLAPRGDLLDGREVAAEGRARLAPGVVAERPEPVLERVERLLEARVPGALDARPDPDGDAIAPDRAILTAQSAGSIAHAGAGGAILCA